MKRITVVFLAATLAMSLVGCGLAPDETIDKDGNVVKTGTSAQALNSPDGTPVIGDPGLAVNPLPPVAFLPSGNTVVTSPYDPTIALPQDPIPLLDPARVAPPTSNPKPNPAAH